jgi:membrane-associated protease RseP (regulator of RpoE activity)
MKVKTMGILFFIVPVGAFVEPDEDELRAATRMKRAKVFSAGPLSNLVFAVLFGVMFSVSMASGSAPIDGVPIQAIEAGSPANDSGLRPGWVITHLDGLATPCLGEFQDLMGNTTTPIRPNTTITLTVRDEPSGPARQVEVTTARRADLFNDSQAQEFYASDPDRANDTVIGFIPYDACTMHAYLSDPFDSLPSFLTYVSLPFFALGGQFPLSEPFNQFFATPAFLPADVFWVAMNLFYWLFWIDLMLGLTNVLPLVPLDGGHMFRDFLDGVFERLKPAGDPALRAKAVNRGAGVMALLILLLIVAQFVGPALIASVRG